MKRIQKAIKKRVQNHIKMVSAIDKVRAFLPESVKDEDLFLKKNVLSVA